MTSSKAIKGGDRVRFVDDERLDIPDALALMELNYDYISDVAGAILGSSKASGAKLPVGGTMSKLVFNTTIPSATTIYGPAGTSTSKAMFLYSYLSQNGYTEVQSLIYNPSASGQQTTIDLSTYVAGNTPYIWARRIDVNTDVDTRKKWDTTGNQEITTSLATRERYRILFNTTLTSSPPDSNVGWFCIAKVVNITSDGVFSFRMVHPFDCGKEPTNNGNEDWTMGTAPWSYMLTDNDLVGSAIAFRTLQNYVASNYAAIGELSTILQTTLNDLNTKITTLESTIDDLTYTVANRTPRFWMRFVANGEGDWYLIDSSVKYISPSIFTINTSPWFIVIVKNNGTPNIYNFNVLDVSVGSYDYSGSTPFVSTPYVATSHMEKGQAAAYIYVKTLSNLITSNSWSSLSTGNPEAGLSIFVAGYQWQNQ